MSCAADATKRGAVLFDMDGTLVDREPLAAQALVDACATANWVLDADQVDQAFGRAWQDVYRELDVEARTGWGAAHFVDLVMAAADSLVAGDYPVPALAGATELVHGLGDRGIPLALVTGSTRREVKATLGPVALLDRFTLVVAAEDYRQGKPAPESYATALRVLGATPACSVGVEDSRAGVAAARAAGLRVLGTRAAHRNGQFRQQDLSDADLVVPGLAHPGLIDWVEAVLSE
jgi:beta-phosphoglucomutase-like phosphatase (HAD superfamily)